MFVLKAYQIISAPRSCLPGDLFASSPVKDGQLVLDGDVGTFQVLDTGLEPADTLRRIHRRVCGEKRKHTRQTMENVYSKKWLWKKANS